MFQQVLQQTRPAAARPSPQPACYAQLRSNAAACPPFIMRRAIQPDLRMRRTDEAFDLESTNPSPDDLAFRIWLQTWLLLVLHAACLSELCSGHQGQRAHNLGRFRDHNVVGLGR